MRYTVRRDLQDGTNAHHSGTEEDRLLSTERLTDDEGRYRAKEAADIVDSRDRSKQRVVVLKAHLIDVVLCDDNAAKDALIMLTQLPNRFRQANYLDHIQRESYP